MSFRSQSIPYASTFAHMAGVRRTVRCTRCSSGGFGGRAAGVPFLFKQWGEFLPAEADEADPTLPDVPNSRLFWSDGSKWDRFDGQRGGVDLVARVGKKAAGRLLDGRTHDEFPA